MLPVMHSNLLEDYSGNAEKDESMMNQNFYLYSEEAMLASKSFMTSVVVGKDIVPRIGLNQLETLRLQLMGEIKNSKQSKVKQFRSFRL